jgi:sugar O-acyltransferase (sialic acid O-acetyltransferase NeuD family)
VKTVAAEPLLIFPCNGTALEAVDCLSNDYALIGFIDDDPQKRGPSREGFQVFPRDALSRWPQARVLAVFGSPASFAARRDTIEGLGVPRSRFACVVHRHASVSPMAKLGTNVLIMAGVVVTSNACVEDDVCILPNSVIHHDAKVRAWTLIGANVTIAGSVDIGENCYIGSGSSIRNGIKVGRGALVGLGANVVSDVRPETRVAGNPAREL